MQADWKDALSALKENMEPQPEEDVAPVQPEQNEKPALKQKNPLYIVTDKKGRNGKIATIIEGFEIPFEEVKEIATKLKQKLGVGGSVREGEILIQGDCKEKVKKFLLENNFKTKG